MNNIYKFVITKYNYRKEQDTLSYEIHDSCRMKSFYFRHLIAKYNMYRNRACVWCWVFGFSGRATQG